jgi:uncharacterized protein YkwD
MEGELLRKLGAALLALPVLLMVYLATIGRSIGRVRAAMLLGSTVLVVLVLANGIRPAPGAAIPPSNPRLVAATLLDPIRTGHSLTAPFTVGFDAPMDPASVAAALRMTPQPAASFAWDDAGTTLTISPVGHWSPGTLYTITIDVSARAADGAALAAPVRAAVLTDSAGAGSISPTRSSGALVRLDSAFLIHVDHPVTAAAVQAALHTDPAVDGAVTAGSGDGDFVFTPAAALAPAARYHVWLDGLADTDGVPFATQPSIQVTTVNAPAVVRFRPVAGTAGVDRGAVLSVRFTEQMNRKATAAAWLVTVGGKPVTGRVAWAETDHVLVFTPAAALPYGAKVVMSVGAGASSKGGVTLAAASTGTFTVKARPVPKPAPKPVAKKPASSTSTSITHSGGTGAVSGTWYSVETYYLKLMNCTRTGGWVTSTGSCSSPGGRNVAPLALSSGISAKVSRPYAKYLAVHGLCNHFYDGSPGDRLRRAGYTSYKWGENIGCEGGNPYSAVLGDHLFFQSEKSYNGGHYVNLMNAMYDQVGIGVWVYSGRVRLVIDFYHP